MQPKIGYLSLVKVRFNECDPMGHLNNANYLTYLEQVAFDAIGAADYDRFALVEKFGALFVVRKHEVTYHQPALENEWLLIRSWGNEIRAARAWREYSVTKFHGDPTTFVQGPVPIGDIPEVDRRDIIVSAITEFAFMNPETGRPARVPQEFIETFFEINPTQ